MNEQYKWTKDAPDIIQDKVDIRLNPYYDKRDNYHELNLDLSIGLLKQYTDEVYRCIVNNFGILRAYGNNGIPFTSKDLYQYFCDLILSKINSINGYKGKYGQETVWFIPPLLAHSIDLLDEGKSIKIRNIQEQYSNQGIEIPLFMAQWGQMYPGLFHKYNVTIVENGPILSNIIDESDGSIQITSNKLKYVDLAALSLIGMTSDFSKLEYVTCNLDDLLVDVKFMATCVFPVRSTRDVIKDSRQMLEIKLKDHGITPQYYLEIDNRKKKREETIKGIGLLYNNVIIDKFKKGEYDSRQSLITIIDAGTWFFRKILSEENFKFSVRESTEIAEEIIRRFSSRVKEGNLITITISIGRVMTSILKDEENGDRFYIPNYIRFLRDAYGLRYVPKNPSIKEDVVQDYSSFVVNHVLDQNLSMEEGARVFSNGLIYFGASFARTREELDEILKKSERMAIELLTIINEMREERRIIFFNTLILSLFSVIYGYIN